MLVPGMDLISVCTAGGFDRGVSHDSRPLSTRLHQLPTHGLQHPPRQAYLNHCTPTRRNRISFQNTSWQFSLVITLSETHVAPRGLVPFLATRAIQADCIGLKGFSQGGMLLPLPHRVCANQLHMRTESLICVVRQLHKYPG